MLELLKSLAVGTAPRGFVEEFRANSVKGWCYVAGPWRRPVTVRVECKGVEIARGSANIFRKDLLDAGIGNGCYGFEIKTPPLAVLHDLKVIPLGSNVPLKSLASNNQPGSEVSQVPSQPVVAGREFIQVFTAEHNHFSGMTVVPCTNGKILSGSSITFSVSRISKGGVLQSEPVCLFTLTEKVEALRGGEHFPIFFEGDPNSQGEQYLLKITSEDATPDNAVAAWIQNGNLRIGGHIRCFDGDNDIGPYGIIAELKYSPPAVKSLVPQTILYSPVTQCNLNCVHCISRETRTSVHRLGGDVREQIRSWCRRGLVHRIYTDYSGDILWADDRWGGELDFLIDLDVPYFVDTNGVHLNEERGLKLLNSKMYGLGVSLDAARPDTYKYIRKGSEPLDVILENAAAFGRLRERENAKERVRFSLGFVMMRSNIEQLLEFIDIGARVGVDRIECRHMEAYTADMAEESLWNHKALFNEIRLAAIEHAEKRGLQLGIMGPLEERPCRASHYFCALPWNGAVVLGNGDVQVCCLPKTKIGNLKEQTMEEIWNGDKYAAFRMAVNSDKPPVFCNSCSYARVPANMQSYLPYLTIDQWVPPYQVKT